MQGASIAYKEHMRSTQELRGQTFIRVTIGLINQEAQASAYVPEQEDYAYYSSFKQPLDNYQVKELYASCDQDYSSADGSMYFLPRRREDVVLNQGIVSKELLGPIEIRFFAPHDIKGLTVEFGKAYPVDFMIESDHNTVEISGNSSGRFITEEIFEGATFFRFIPLKMKNGQSRFRIHQITMGIGIYFDNRKILQATKKEHISPITEELPAIDFELTVNNKDRAFDIENEESTVNFLEIGQRIEVIYGQELPDGSVEWMPGTALQLREWEADDEQMSFSASDRFEDLNGMYYRGTYRKEGISLYDLAVDVMEDAGVDSRTYWLDGYLKDILVKNPMPPVSHKEALQIIANAGRCILYQDRAGNIFMKSSFIPEMEAVSDNETYFSSAASVLTPSEKIEYSLSGMDYTGVKPSQYFLPRQSKEMMHLNTGYISEMAAGEDGSFPANPTIEIILEARYKCFGLTLEFGRNHPDKMIFHAYLSGELQEDYEISGLSEVTVISHEFPEFDHLILEFVKGYPNNRVTLKQVTFGDSTDYELSYRHELSKTPKGKQISKVRELQVVRTLYRESSEVKELAKETVFVSQENNRYIFYFTRPSYDLSCELTNAEGGQGARIISQSSFYAEVEIFGASGECEVSVTGREYAESQSMLVRQLNVSGSLETWENPLVSDASHAADLADWIGDYMKADREYDSLQYRGDTRIDANDLVFLENKYVPDLLLRVYEHTLKFNGSLSGTIKARRDMSRVAAAKDRLVRK